jgi:hypothetical protein
MVLVNLERQLCCTIIPLHNEFFYSTVVNESIGKQILMECPSHFPGKSGWSLCKTSAEAYVVVSGRARVASCCMFGMSWTSNNPLNCLYEISVPCTSPRYPSGHKKAVAYILVKSSVIAVVLLVRSGTDLL